MIITVKRREDVEWLASHKKFHAYCRIGLFLMEISIVNGKKANEKTLMNIMPWKKWGNKD